LLGSLFRKLQVNNITDDIVYFLMCTDPHLGTCPRGENRNISSPIPHIEIFPVSGAFRRESNYPSLSHLHHPPGITIFNLCHFLHAPVSFVHSRIVIMCRYLDT